MADSEEEIDYMSEDFLAQCVGNNDVRPGLLFSHSSKRKAQIDKQRKHKNESNRERFKPVKQVQQERLQEGLNTALDSSNKGFSMLQKMGYKPGSSLGKQGQGKLEPIAVELKADRVGLGWQEMISEHRKKQQEIKRQKQEKHKEEIDPEKFRARMRNQQQEKLINADLMKSQRICHQMDSKAELNEPVEPWFWPKYALKKESEEDEEEEEEVEEELEFEPEEQLNILTAYLKATYCYCIWCGTVYDDERDFKQNCPGQTRADHDD
ncbi:G patch domain-containing protein 11-like [Penaeus monodon]|uniref:G patch domain-containing protein 11-like n=1 Tax=Penaeus monodon TaxID=6687 RepID=UPI0018A7A99F|nr:G patch domain-containing protein 11-like [Penaeus monodon]